MPACLLHNHRQSSDIPRFDMRLCHRFTTTSGKKMIGISIAERTDPPGSAHNLHHRAELSNIGKMIEPAK